MIEIKLPSIKNIALLIVTIAVMLVVIEFSLKVVTPQRCYAYPRGMVVEDEQLCYRLSQNYEGRIKTAEFDIGITTNSHGLRDKEYSYEKPANTIRILGLGDSFQFGVGVEEKDTYLNVLEESLNKNREDKKYEIINTAVLGYGTIQQLRYFKEEGRKYKPDIVIVSFYSNDLIDNVMTLESCNRFVRDGYLIDNFTASQRTASFKIKLFLNQKSDLYCLAKNSALKLLPNLRGINTKANISKENILTYLKKGNLSKEIQQQLNITFDILKQLKVAVENEEAKFVIVIIPDQLQVDKEVMQRAVREYGIKLEDYNVSRLNSIMIDFAERENITSIDLLPEFEKEGERKKLYYFIEAHWNKEGHKLAAGIVKEKLIEEGII